ncbi:uncharacterized protein FIBRA_07989 [Fibroporia radiculosa]|uniref:Uncharacterized protein n=1 Tax=Fibroporia radiculosa TaxID=599839 RepID=J4I1U9_9APHY|nr:uncharacterized protein FIBRA_07989 [Fibroporia radiculosa]CCM05757.1 predicted protein [Fibroporia radiculosa]
MAIMTTITSARVRLQGLVFFFLVTILLAIYDTHDSRAAGIVS